MINVKSTNKIKSRISNESFDWKSTDLDNSIIISGSYIIADESKIESNDKVFKQFQHQSV